MCRLNLSGQPNCNENNDNSVLLFLLRIVYFNNHLLICLSPFQSIISLKAFLFSLYLVLKLALPRTTESRNGQYFPRKALILAFYLHQKKKKKMRTHNYIPQSLRSSVLTPSIVKIKLYPAWSRGDHHHSFQVRIISRLVPSSFHILRSQPRISLVFSDSNRGNVLLVEQHIVRDSQNPYF